MAEMGKLKVVGRGRCHLFGRWHDMSVAHTILVRHRLPIFVAHL